MKPTEAFLHPKRTAALVDELAEENEALREAAAEAGCSARVDAEACAKAEREAGELRARLKGQEQSQQELMKLLLATRSDLEGRVRELQERLDAASVDNEELEEIYVQVQRMTESQEAYRRRIADLKTQLAEARAEAARLAGRRSSGLRPSIAMEDVAASVDAASRDASAGDAVPASPPPRPGTGFPTPDSDWLLPLPADL